MSRRKPSLWKRVKAAWRSVQPNAGSYQGASDSRLTADWVFSILASADQEIRGDIRKLRMRGRDLARNHPHVARFLNMLEENVVGHQGIRLQVKAETPGGDLDTNANALVEAAWNDWGRAETASADGRLSWRGMVSLAQQTEAQDGEYLIRLLPGFPNRYRFAVQMLDVDQLDTEYNRPADRNSGEIRMGVEIDKWGRPIAYHVFDRHPFDLIATGPTTRRERIRIPADQIVHEYIVQRPGQTRGITWLAPVLITARMLAGYREAELVAARTASAKMGFFRPDADVQDDDGDGAIPMDADPGSFGVLPAGYEFSPWDPQHPTTAFADFDKAIMRTLASGLRTGYNKLASDLEGVSFSSLRQDALTEQDVWRILQQRKIENLCDRVYREWLKWAVTSGALRLGTFDLARFHKVSWRGRGWDWVRPLEEAKAFDSLIQLGVESRTRIAARRGYDLEEVLREQAREKELAAELGLRLGGVPQASGQARADVDRAELDAFDEADEPPSTNGNGRIPAELLNGED